MTATLIKYNQTTEEKIQELAEENYAQDDMYAFIEEYGQDAFVQFYEEYVTFGEDHCYEAVDAFIDAFGIDCLASFEDAYYGQYDSEEEFSEQYVGDAYSHQLQDLPIVIDWTATWETNLRYDFTFNEGFVFNSNF